MDMLIKQIVGIFSQCISNYHNVYFKQLTIFLNLFIYLFMAGLGLRFCARAFSSCGKWGPLFIAVRGPLISRPLLLQSTGSRHAGSVVVAHGPSCSVACGIFPDQGSNLCHLHWQADSQPLRHQGSPKQLTILSIVCQYSQKGQNDTIQGWSWYGNPVSFILFIYL